MLRATGAYALAPGRWGRARAWPMGPRSRGGRWSPPPHRAPRRARRGRCRSLGQGASKHPKPQLTQCYGVM